MARVRGYVRLSQSARTVCYNARRAEELLPRQASDCSTKGHSAPSENPLTSAALDQYSP